MVFPLMLVVNNPKKGGYASVFLKDIPKWFRRSFGFLENGKRFAGMWRNMETARSLGSPPKLSYVHTVPP